MSKENKAIVRRSFEEGWNQGNLAVFDEICGPNYVFHDPILEADIQGSEGLKQYAAMYCTAFPDLHFTIEAQVAEGDKVSTRWTSTGTHKGELMGIPPTGKQTTSTGIVITRFAESLSEASLRLRRQDSGRLECLGYHRADATAWRYPSDGTR